MLKITALDGIQNIESPMLRESIEQRTIELMTDYEAENLNSIGCFIVLDAEEYPQFRMDEMEFVEVMLLNNETYLHGVRIVSNGYGEDVYLAMERVT